MQFDTPQALALGAVIIALPLIWHYFISAANEAASDKANLAYNVQKYGHILRWTRHCLFIHDKPVVLLGGEFHYWRVPDRERWRSILETYKAAGLNCIRIYFHFAHHSPNENSFIFDGNRDIDYLLDLCEEIGLYVLAAPGPYICAETSGGGFPFWLVSKTSIRIRHALFSIVKVFDKRFMADCKKWIDAVIPIIARHQITNKASGCVLAVQIENELLPIPVISLLPFPFDKYMRQLTKMFRDAGCNVPIFHNDPMLLGSFNPGKGFHGMDLYSFDRYVIIPPVKDQDNVEWKDEKFISEIDHSEVRTRSFGGGAASSPIFVAELQGGWFHQHGCKGSYDGLYKFFGETFTQNIVQSFMAQGSTIVSVYMFYGGTNWGTLGDPDVYSSYDYAACIREYGYVSGRFRHLRLLALFVQAFNLSLAQTDNVQLISSLKNAKLFRCNGDRVINVERQSISDGTVFCFLRNFNPLKGTQFTLSVIIEEYGEIGPLPLYLPYRESFIAVAKHSLFPQSDSPRILLSSVPILGKGYVGSDYVILVMASGGGLLIDRVEGISEQSGNISSSLDDPKKIAKLMLTNRGMVRLLPTPFRVPRLL